MVSGCIYKSIGWTTLALIRLNTIAGIRDFCGLKRKHRRYIFREVWHNNMFGLMSLTTIA